MKGYRALKMGDPGSKQNALLDILLTPSAEAEELPFSLLEHITQKFSDKLIIGRGGFGVVYKGELQDGTMIAVKRLQLNGQILDDDSFHAELSILKKLKHENIVRFLGYCIHSENQEYIHRDQKILVEKRERLLCFEYVPNGTIPKEDAHQGLEWTQRYQIIKGICDGLEYIHNAGYIHLDLKPSNILLDTNMVPKITDFGLSKFFDNQSTRNTMNKLGTLGYMAPEYIHHGTVSKKADIYSLGVVILELVTGSKGPGFYERIEKGKDEMYILQELTSWKKKLSYHHRGQSLERAWQQVETCIKIALNCTDQSRENRPQIKEIAQMLDMTLDPDITEVVLAKNLDLLQGIDMHKNKSWSHKCAACFRKFNKMEHLVEHMRAARHSSHEPRCDICGKHCSSFDILRDHLGVGGSSVPKAANCTDAFAARGCTICLSVLSSATALGSHRAACRLSRCSSLSRLQLQHHEQPATQPQEGGGALVLSCQMVGAGSNGSLDVLARVCVTDEQECILLEAFVEPLIPVTHYRYETTGIRPEHLRAGVCVTVKNVRRRVADLLLNGEQPGKVRTSRGKARLLVGHGLDHALGALGMDYPAYLKRDTATYPPLMKTSKQSSSLKLLTLKYLGYEIHTGHQHPYEDCLAAMRLYRRMRGQQHPKGSGDADAPAANANQAWSQQELERIKPEENRLLRLSTPDYHYHCWCLDA